MKSFLKKIIPASLVIAYHKLQAFCAAVYYRFPTKKLVVVGITGTKGKTSAANYVWSVLTAGGKAAGLIGTANIRIGTEERLNTHHMTMPGPWILQKLFREMVSKKCTHVVLEATSEGMKYYRHIGILFDTAIFTNLTPEHLPSHGGSFELYKQTKARLFESLAHARKIVDGKRVLTHIIANADSPHAEYYLKYASDTKTTFGIDAGDLRANDISETPHGVSFYVDETSYALSIPGRFNIYNALPAIAMGQIEQIAVENIQQGLRDLTLIPGRMERIDAGQPFTVIVDYAHENVSMNAVLDTARAMTHGKVIVLLGAEGGGRDKKKREDMGIAAGKKADVVILSNVDPYDDDPQEIVDDIAKHVLAQGKKEGVELFRILDRRSGIEKAFSMATEGDSVIITGKGAEQSMIIGKEHIPWDDRTVVRELLEKIGYTNR